MLGRLQEGFLRHLAGSEEVEVSVGPGEESVLDSSVLRRRIAEHGEKLFVVQEEAHGVVNFCGEQLGGPVSVESVFDSEVRTLDRRLDLERVEGIAQTHHALLMLVVDEQEFSARRFHRHVFEGSDGVEPVQLFDQSDLADGNFDDFAVSVLGFFPDQLGEMFFLDGPPADFAAVGDPDESERTVSGLVRFEVHNRFPFSELCTVENLTPWSS